ncbi:MAG: hypothetical protein PUE08_07815 [Eubacteriales bacterium]|nr:hypothetical protein [Eubacteriales bacterium]
MTDKIEKAFYLSKEEMGVLLDSKNCHTLNCLNIFGNRVKISESDAHMSLYSMLQEGLVEIEDDCFRITEELDTIITAVASAQKAAAVYSPFYQSVAFYKYNSSCVLTQYGDHRDEKMKVSSVSGEDVVDIIVDKFRLNINESVEASQELTDSHDDMYFTSLLLLGLDDDSSKLIQSDRIVLFIDFVDLSQDMSYKKLAVVKHGIGLAVIVWSRSDVKTYPYKKALLSQVIDKDFLEV